jgi:hypothetical protein
VQPSLKRRTSLSQPQIIELKITATMSKPSSAATEKPAFASKTEEFQAKIKEAFNLYENEGMIEAE